MTSDTTATATVQSDDEQVRVTKWDFPPGTQTGSHTHEYDYVVVPISTGTLTVQTAEGEFANPLVPGASYQRSAGTKHNVVNESEQECSFVEVELKLAT
ncbi:MAG: cupin domain-containing protein [Nesterenkonia sp.]